MGQESSKKKLQVDLMKGDWRQYEPVISLEVVFGEAFMGLSSVTLCTWWTDGCQARGAPARCIWAVW